MPLIEVSAEGTGIPGLLVITTKQITDDRGRVREFFRTSSYEEILGLDPPFRLAQVNLTQTGGGAIRGLHGEDMCKLVGVVAGAAFGAYVDARADSASFGTVVTVELEVGTEVLVPRGVLNGFQALGTGCEYLYGFDVEWRPDMPSVGANALDEELAIPWPESVERSDRSRLSDKDAGLPPFSSLRQGLGALNR